MPAGYSKRPLIDKLGIKSGFNVAILNAPSNYKDTLGPLPPKVAMKKQLTKDLDFIQFFTKEKSELESQFPKLKKHLSQNGTIWISWPKGASKIKTDVNENIAREIGLDNGLVDVKVCAVDEIWSGLKFVYRLKDRD